MLRGVRGLLRSVIWSCFKCTHGVTGITTVIPDAGYYPLLSLDALFLGR